METDFVEPLQAAVLKHHSAAADFDGGKAASAVALGGLEGSGGFTQTLQPPICGRDETRAIKNIKHQAFCLSNMTATIRRVGFILHLNLSVE